MNAQIRMDGEPDVAAAERRMCCSVDALQGTLVVELFKALGDLSRATILASLAGADGPLRVTEIGTCCPQDLSVVSRHLAILRAAGVVESERRGREVYYRIRRDEVVRALRDLADALESTADGERTQKEEQR
jgi:DNA-binding transcriptional ArsR family regulator